MPVQVESLLAERQKTYGGYAAVASTAQQIKDVMSCGSNYNTTTYAQRESLAMIANKISRIVNGDPNYEDSWADIAGYATLALRTIEEGKLGPF